jgi:hypothetical protein
MNENQQRMKGAKAGFRRLRGAARREQRALLRRARPGFAHDRAGWSGSSQIKVNQGKKNKSSG